MSERKSWLCLICHRSGVETEMSEARTRHWMMLMADKQNNERMTALCGASWVGPSSTCTGNIVIGAAAKSKRRRIRSQVFGEAEGDPWIEVGAKIEVSGRVRERYVNDREEK